MKLNEMKVKDVIQTDVYRRLMSEQIAREENTQRKAAYKARATGTRLKRIVMDGLREKGVLNADDMTKLFKAVMAKQLVGFSSTERRYIYDVGLVVYKNTIIELRRQEGGNDGPDKKTV